MSIYLPGFEPDAVERAQLRFVGGVLASASSTRF